MEKIFTLRIGNGLAPTRLGSIRVFPAMGFIVVGWLGVALPSSCGQTLTEKLIAEKPARLIEESRKKGNLVRGAILFHQGNINCAQCHRPKSEADRVGPDLAKLGSEITDESLVESILQPSKKIDPLYRSVRVLTLDGEPFTGQLVRNTESEIVLRDHKNVTQTRTFQKRDLDEIAPVTQSSMPDDLCEQLKGRQQFLDLLRYVLEVKERGPTDDDLIPVNVRQKLGKRMEGLALIDRFQCTNCHQREKTNQLTPSKQAPDLRWSGKHLNPKYLQSFIANPHQTKPGTSMPDLLGSLTATERAKSAEAITHFLVSQNRNAYQPLAADRIAARRGQKLFHSVGCVACHAPRDDRGTEVPLAHSLPLGDLSNKYSITALTNFLQDPHVVRPSERMPNLNLAHEEAAAIAAYLLGQKKVDGPLQFTVFTDCLSNGKMILEGNERRAGIVDSFSIASFQDLADDFAVSFEGFIEVKVDGDYQFFVEVNDAAKLVVDDQVVIDLKPKPGDQTRTAKGSISLKKGWRKIGLTYFQVRNKKHLDLQWQGPGFPKSRIPTGILKSDQTDSKPFQPFEVKQQLVIEGKRKFTDLNCAVCHTTVIETGKVSTDRSVPFDQLKPDQGCLSAKPGDWPKFELSDSQRSAIAAAINERDRKLTSEQTILTSLATLNCLACHDRNQIGGVTDLRTAHFKTDNLNLGEQGRIPPSLTGVGAKLNPKWLRDVLVNGRAIRPYMKTRMPKYREQNVRHLIEDFQESDKLAKMNFAKFKDQKAIRKTGLELVGNKGLNCVACHTYQFKTSDTMPAVDLTEMAARLKKDWFYDYMLAPQKYSPNTVMPSFWPGGKAMRHDILQGDSKLQVEAIWQYLLDGRQAGAPRGVVREPLEIVVTNEARMLRRSYPGIGKRGIGVGYPGGVNLAFDAEQMRLAMIWSGKFADPSGVWRGQGSGQVRPLGRPISFAKGPDLDDASEPWTVDDGRPPKHQFKGYYLDDLQRPTFMYRFDGIAVEDYFSEQKPSATQPTELRRSVSFQSVAERKGIAFRVANGKSIEDKGGGVFVVDKKISIKIESDSNAKIVETLAGKQLSIPFDLNKDKTHTLRFTYSWLDKK